MPATEACSGLMIKEDVEHTLRQAVRDRDYCRTRFLKRIIDEYGHCRPSRPDDKIVRTPFYLTQSALLSAT